MPGKSSARARVTPPLKAEAKVLFQKYFKSMGPRTYACQIKESRKGNPFLVISEGKRDEDSGEVKKTKVFVFSEDFGQFFRMLHETAQYLKANPVPEEIKLRRQRYWARKEAAAITPPSIAMLTARTTNRRPARGR